MKIRATEVPAQSTKSGKFPCLHRLDHLQVSLVLMGLETEMNHHSEVKIISGNLNNFHFGYLCILESVLLFWEHLPLLPRWALGGPVQSIPNCLLSWVFHETHQDT